MAYLHKRKARKVTRLSIISCSDVLPSADIEIAMEFLDHDEWGCAIEHLAARVVDLEVTLPSMSADALLRAADVLGIGADMRRRLALAGG